jgi:hypothetical protein
VRGGEEGERKRERWRKTERDRERAPTSQRLGLYTEPQERLGVQWCPASSEMLRCHILKEKIW